MEKLLATEQVEALQAVNVQLGFISHGSSQMLPVHGPAELGVTDRDYSLVHRIVSPLQSGDVMARESEGGQDALLPSQTIYRLRERLRDSLYANHTDMTGEAFDAWMQAQAKAEKINSIGIQGNPGLETLLADKLELARKLHIISPMIDYADGLAALAGVRSVVADSPSERYGYENRRSYGNADMVKVLGNTAIEMLEQPNCSQPTLAFIAGRGHIGVKHLLKQAGIPFSIQKTTQPFGLLVRSIRGQHTVDRYVANKWLENIQAHQQSKV